LKVIKEIIIIVAGYADPLLFLFERTYNYYVVAEAANS